MKQIIVSAGDAITARLVEEAGFDGIWVSGFELSSSLLLVDNGVITMNEILSVVSQISKAVKLPIYVDCDSGGSLHQSLRMARELENAGAFAMCIEDNPLEKTNSLWESDIKLISKEEHGRKIKVIKEYANIKVIARTEALIRGYGEEEALKRAKYYVECGADMILMHSREKTGKEALEIAKKWENSVPLVIVPTKFPHVTNKQLFDAGYDAIIWANQTLRTKLLAVRKMLQELKKTDCGLSIEKNFSASLDDLRNLTPIKEVEKIDEKYDIKK